MNSEINRGEFEKKRNLGEFLWIILEDNEVFGEVDVNQNNGIFFQDIVVIDFKCIVDLKNVWQDVYLVDLGSCFYLICFFF